MTQCLTNVISNALKFTKKGKVSVLCKTEVSKDLKKARIHLSGLFHVILVNASVSDTGIGMSASAQEKIFKPFSQAEESTTRLYGGTGTSLFASND